MVGRIDVPQDLGEPELRALGRDGANKYLAENASTLSYTVTITINADGGWTYDETTTLKMNEFDEPFVHTDHNTLRRVP